jgi:hypothetical protein
MKIKEVIIEDAVGKVPKRYQRAAMGLHKFRDENFADRIYELNRVMMAVAAADGKDTNKIPVDIESWAGRFDIAAPLTKEEENMLKQAYKTIGSYWSDENPGPFKAQEIDTVNKNSPVPKRKRNKYGV